MRNFRSSSKRLFNWSAPFIWTLIASGCSHAPIASSRHGLLSPDVAPSKIEIEYILGRDLHRFQADALGDSISAATYRNRQVVEAGKIDPKKYPDFLKKASDFVRTCQARQESSTQKYDSSAPSDPSCRSPFTVTVRIQDRVETSRGCRSTDDGSLSRLVRDGEFLLYSKN